MSVNAKKTVSVIDFPNRAKKEKEAAVRECEVVDINDKGVFINIAGNAKLAKISFSCLVQPMPGDLVLCSMSEKGQYYILSIIERPGAQDINFSFPADVSMHMPRGDFSLLSEKSITFASGGSLNCVSDKAMHKSREAAIDFEKATAKGQNLIASFKTVSMVSRVVNTIAERLTKRVKSYIRHSKDYDQVKAGEMTRKADGLFSMDSNRTVMISKKDTIIDGEHIFTAL